jgi:two-component system chemotaxis response regulator CheB
MVKVLIVEDSPVTQEYLKYILDSEPDLEVMGMVADGVAALNFIQKQQPNVILMDINMPKLNGIEATRRIMETRAVPIVIVSGAYNVNETKMAFEAMQAGAVAIVEKPKGIGHPDYEAVAKQLARTVKLMSEVKVIRRRRPQPAPTTSADPPLDLPKLAAPIRLVTIGASAGGTVALEIVLARLAKNFAAPVLIVQHITPGFLEGLVASLSQTCALPIQVAKHGESLQAGRVYFAPDHCQMGVDALRRIVLTNDLPENGCRPAVSYLFRSVATHVRNDGVGVILTGMGRDGAAELKLMRDKGFITIAQDAATSLVHGMPGEAIKLGAAQHVLPIEQVAAMLNRLALKSP